MATPAFPLNFQSLGIDASTSATGLVILQESRPLPVMILNETVKSKETGWARIDEIVDRVMRILNEYPVQRVVIENYGFSFKHPGSIVPLVELGTVLRRALHSWNTKYITPSPNEVKEFLTGKGNAKKPEMRKQVLNEWGYKVGSFDEADAFACALIGLGHAGRLPRASERRREIAATLAEK